MPETASSHVEIDVTLDVDLADAVALQAEALKTVPPSTPHTWSYRASLHHLLLWPLVKAVQHSPVVDLHGAKITEVRAAESTPTHEPAAARR